MTRTSLVFCIGSLLACGPAAGRAPIHQFLVAEPARAKFVAFDAKGDLVIGGESQGGGTVGGAKLPTFHYVASFVAKFGPTYGFQWIRADLPSLGGAGAQPTALAVGADGSSALAGSLFGPTDFGTGPVSHLGSKFDGLLVGINP